MCKIYMNINIKININICVCTGCTQKVDNVEAALNLAKRLETKGVRILEHIKNGLRAKFN